MEASTENLAALIQLLNLSKKKEVRDHCRTFVLNGSSLVGLIMAGGAGALDPYVYIANFKESLPSHLRPTKDQENSARNLRPGLLEGEALKFVRKAFQTFEERRLLASHLFYTSSLEYWHLFYFDQRDVDEHTNHWKFGAHIHYISDLFTTTSLQEIWESLTTRGSPPGGSLHLRYDSVA
jgi:hypothetical protein